MIDFALRRLNVNPSGAPRQLPLHKGAMSWCDFSALCRRETNAKFKFSKPESLHFFLLWQRSASPVAFLREEGGTRKRDGRSLRDGKTAETFCFAPLVVFHFLIRKIFAVVTFSHCSRSPVGCPLSKRGAVAAGD